MLKPNEPKMGLPPIGLIILAAGASTRMGQPKQLLHIQGESLIRRAVQTALLSVCKPVLVVLGANQELIQPEIADLPIHIVHNPAWEQGMSSSIRMGLQQLITLSESCEGAILMLCDQPLVNSDLINQLVKHYQPSIQLAIACEYGGNIGVPALFGRELFGELMQLKGRAGAKKVIESNIQSLHRIHFPDGAWDVDTPEDYTILMERLGTIH